MKLNTLTEHADSSGGLCIAQREGGHLAGVDADVSKAHILQYNGGIVGGGRAKEQAVGVLRRDGDAEHGVVDRHRDGAGAQTAFPGTLGQAEVGAHLHPALQGHVLPQHGVHSRGHHHLTAPHTWSHREEREREETQTNKTLKCDSNSGAYIKQTDLFVFFTLGF